MRTSNREHNASTSSDPFGGIAMAKVTEMDFVQAIDAISVSSLPSHVKAALATAALASGPDYRDVSFIVDDPDYIRAEVAAQVIRCQLALDEREVSSEFNLASLSPRYRTLYFRILRFLSGEDAEANFKKEPVGCAMAWLVMDPVGLSAVLERGEKVHRLLAN